jgi:predicted nucleic acid-binding protein
MVLVDANVLLDLLTDDPQWFKWSSLQVKKARRVGLLIVNPIIYAEISNAFESEDLLDAYVSPTDFVRAPLPYGAAFLAGRAFRRYRMNGGNRTSPLPDFYIGAHAQVDGLTLLTRDVARYKTYFPKVKLIHP